MELGKRHYVTRGVFYGHAAVSQLDVTLYDFLACSDRFTRPVESLHQSYVGWTPSDVTPQSLDELTPFLVAYHEREHYRELMSSPCGLLTWRALNGVASAVGFLVEKISKSSACESVRLPLTDWYVNGGRQALEHDPPEMLPAQRKQGIDEEDYRAAIIPYMDAVFGEIEILLRFLDAFEERAQLTMREFVGLANAAFYWLAQRAELPLNVRWSAHDLDAPSYLPAGAVTFNEIVEAAARMWELQLLRRFGATGALVEEWYQRAIFGVYKPAYDYLWSELGDPWLSRLAIDIALTSPVDLACSGATDGVIYVEDVLPSWRLPRVVRSMRDEFWPADRSGQELEVRRNIAMRAGIPTPEATLAAALSGPISGATAWSADVKLQEVPEEITGIEYYEGMQNEIRRGFKARYDDALVFLFPEKAPEVFQPALEYFRDISFFHESPAGERSSVFHLKAHRTIIGIMAALALLSDGDLAGMQPLEKSFEARMKQKFGDVSQVHALWRVSSVLEQSFREPFRRLFRP